MLGIEEKDPVITGKYADDLYEEYKSVYGEPEYHKNDKQVQPNMSKQQHSLTYERTDDMSVLSDFYCGIEEMDHYIHNKLQAKVNSMPELESYIIREAGSIVAMTAIREKPLEVKKSNGERFCIDALEIEYLAVRKDLRDTGIGETIIQWIDDKARAEHNNCRYLSVNALVDPDYGYSAVPFYEKCSFIPRKSHAMAVAVRMTRIIKQVQAN